MCSLFGRLERFIALLIIISGFWVQPIVRLSSARSSYASSGWNRYFQNRSAHGTFDGDLTSFTANGIALLNSLGEEDPFEHNNSSDELGEMRYKLNRTLKLILYVV